MWLYYWEKYGYDKAEQIFKRDYIAERGHVKNKKAHLVNVLDGKLEFLKMVKGKEDSTYAKLYNRFIQLSAPQSDLVKVLSIWETQGIEKAMEFFTPLKTKDNETTTKGLKRGTLTKEDVDNVKDKVKKGTALRNSGFDGLNEILGRKNEKTFLDETNEERLKKIEEIKNELQAKKADKESGNQQNSEGDKPFTFIL